jgi:autotransporter-associated beta strand protein
VKTGSGRLVLAGANSYAGGTTLLAGTLEASSAASLASGSEAGRITVVGGTLTLPADRSDVVALSLLSIAQTRAARLDLGASRIDIAAGGITAADLKADVLAGRAGGLWSGSSGITSAAVAVVGQTRSVGWLANADGTLRVGFAANGDTNIDGSIDILDAANFVASNRFDTGAAANWQDGDFNYDGVVDILDAGDFLAADLYDAGVYLPVTVPQVTAVPEPDVPWSWSAAVALAALARRRPWPARSSTAA